MKKIFIVLISLCIPFSGFTYNTTNHEAITQQAIYLLNSSYCPDFITPEEAKMIIKGNVSEDKNVFKGLIRYFNQHFYNPLKDEKYRKRNYSINSRFERITKRLFKRVNSKKYFKSVGEILHHIQDVTNPSHVVPVCHGPGLKDKFDEHYLACYFPKRVVIDTEMVEDTVTLEKTVKPIAIKTLNALKQNFEVCIMQDEVCIPLKMDWSQFWNGNPTDWFGQYGHLGRPNKCADKKIDNYFVSTIKKGNVTYFIDRHIYEDFSRQQVELAVMETARFLFFTKRRYANEHTNLKTTCVLKETSRYLVIEAI